MNRKALMRPIAVLLPISRSLLPRLGNLPRIVIPASGRAVVALLCVLSGFRAWSADCVSPPAGLIGWWRGENNGNDSAGTNNAYAMPNVSFTNGIVGQAFAFDPESSPYGAYTGVQIADQPGYVLTNSLSIEGWIRPRGDSSIIFWRGDNRGGLDPYAMNQLQCRARADASFPRLRNSARWTGCLVAGRRQCG